MALFGTGYTFTFQVWKMIIKIEEIKYMVANEKAQDFHVNGNVIKPNKNLNTYELQYPKKKITNTNEITHFRQMVVKTNTNKESMKYGNMDEATGKM